MFEYVSVSEQNFDFDAVFYGYFLERVKIKKSVFRLFSSLWSEINNIRQKSVEMKEILRIFYDNLTCKFIVLY